MDSRKTVLLAILAAALMVAVSIGCATVVNNTGSNDSNDTAFSADVWKKNTDSNNDNSMTLNAMDWTRMTSSSAANSDNASMFGAIRPIIHFDDDCSVANSNEKVTPDWFIGKIVDASTRMSWLVVHIEYVYDLCDGIIVFGGSCVGTADLTVYEGSKLFGGTWEEFQQYVIANECEWPSPYPPLSANLVSNSNSSVSPEWFVGRVFEADLGDTTAIYKIENVFELLPGGIMYCGPFHYTGLTNVHQGGSLFCGTWEEFQQYVIAHECPF